MTNKPKYVTRTPAIPPHDYKGSQADWEITLQEFGLWDGETPDWPGDLMITSDQWWEVLWKCEGEPEE
jgi:hypothetical protein